MTGACAGSLPNFGKKPLAFCVTFPAQAQPKPPTRIGFSKDFILEVNGVKSSYESILDELRKFQKHVIAGCPTCQVGHRGKGQVSHVSKKTRAKVCTCLHNASNMGLVHCYRRLPGNRGTYLVNPLYISHYFMFLFPYVHSHIFPMEPVFTIYKTTWYKEYRQI